MHGQNYYLRQWQIHTHACLGWKDRLSFRHEKLQARWFCLFWKLGVWVQPDPKLELHGHIKFSGNLIVYHDGLGRQKHINQEGRALVALELIWLCGEILLARTERDKAFPWSNLLDKWHQEPNFLESGMGLAFIIWLLNCTHRDSSGIQRWVNINWNSKSH